jgi:hypothetical protein
MTQSIYYQRVKVNVCYFVTSSLPGIYKSLTDYCFLALPQKERNPDYGFCEFFSHELYKTYIGTSPFKPIRPRKPKFPAVVSYHA